MTALCILAVAVNLHGGCVHHDTGPLGAASHPDAERWKVRKLKEAGFNAVRLGCNPFPEAFLEACDEEGLFVIDDMFDMWREGKSEADFSRDFERDWAEALEAVVRRDRVHPSVAMWSIGNEILERTSDWAAEQAVRMVRLCKKLDPGRPVTMALCTWGGDDEWLAQDKLASALDIVGYNYAENRVDDDHARHPERVIVLTETYPRDATNVWRIVKDRPYVIGEFVWSAMDYRGESMIGRSYYEGEEEPGDHFKIKNSFPWHGANCGDIDLIGRRKPISHLRETLWNENAPTYLAVREPDGWKGKIVTTDWGTWPTFESWNFKGWEGKPVFVEVYSRAPRVRLVVNGSVAGEKPNGEDNAYFSEFAVAYEPGEIVAYGIDAHGNVLDSARIATSGEPVAVRFVSETVGELEFLTAETVDANGVFCPDGEIDVEFDGDVIATASDNMKDCVPATSRIRRTSHGRAMAVRRVHRPGTDSRRQAF